MIVESKISTSVSPNWNKIQVVLSKGLEGEALIMTTGENTDNCFSGMVIYSDNKTEIGRYSTTWDKKDFIV